MKMLIIQTGGTIDKDYPKLSGGYAFEFSEEMAAKRILNNVNHDIDFEFISVCKKDSLDLTDFERTEIRKVILSSSFDRIIITHGTDTIVNTAFFLADIRDKIIVLTGSFKPERFIDSDASFNLGMAVGAAQCLPYGIYLAINARIFEYDKVKRDFQTGRFIDTQ